MIPFVDGAFDFWPLWESGEWEPETRLVLERFLTGQRYTCLIDIGAWIGPVAIWGAELGATVYAFEPDPVAYPQLVHNTAPYPAVHCHQVAIATTSGTGHLAAFREDFGYGDSQSRLAEEGVPVDTLSPTDLIQSCPMVTVPALIKLDIEGGECDVIPGLIEATHGLTPLYISWHEPWWPNPVNDETRTGWFDGYTLEAIRGDGWTGFSELLAVPR